MEAHDPLQLDFVFVSGANQYSVNPFAFVSTVTPLIFLVFRAVLDELVLGDETTLTEEPAAPAAPAVPVPAQAATISAVAPGQPAPTIGYASHTPRYMPSSGDPTQLPPARNAPLWLPTARPRTPSAPRRRC